MSNLEQNNSNAVGIERGHWDVPVKVDFRAYLDFTRRMNVQLKRLVERRESKAAPASKGIKRSNFRYVESTVGKEEL